VAVLALALTGCGSTAAAGSRLASLSGQPADLPTTPAPSPTAPSPVRDTPAAVTLGADDAAVPADAPAQEPGPFAGAATVTLALGETAEVGGLRLRFAELVEDSRCPDGATCVWAGRVVVRLEVVGADDPATLSLGMPGLTPDAPLSHVVAGRQIALVDLSPFPKIGVEPAADAYSLTLDVRPAP